MFSSATYFSFELSGELLQVKYILSAVLGVGVYLYTVQPFLTDITVIQFQ